MHGRLDGERRHVAQLLTGHRPAPRRSCSRDALLEAAQRRAFHRYRRRCAGVSAAELVMWKMAPSSDVGHLRQLPGHEGRVDQGQAAARPGSPDRGADAGPGRHSAGSSRSPGHRRPRARHSSCVSARPCGTCCAAPRWPPPCRDCRLLLELQRQRTQHRHGPETQQQPPPCSPDDDDGNGSWTGRRRSGHDVFPLPNRCAAMRSFSKAGW
jgi:hypothetical protein